MNSSDAVEFNLRQRRTIHFRKFHDTVPLDNDGSNSKRKRLFGAQRQQVLKAEPESADTPKAEQSSPRKPKLPNPFDSSTSADFAVQDPKPFLRSQSSNSLPEEALREAKAVLIDSKPQHERSQSLGDTKTEAWQRPQGLMIGSTSQTSKPIGQLKLPGRSSQPLPSIGESRVPFLLCDHISLSLDLWLAFALL